MHRHQPHPHIRTLHSYRAKLMPANINPADVEQLAGANKLPSIRVRATDAEQAAAAAHHVTGKPVHSVERVEG